jgi:lysophospholipase L1-like esterase
MRKALAGLLGVAIGVVASLILCELVVRGYLALRTSPIEASSKVDGPFMQHHPVRGFCLAPNTNTRMAGREYDVAVRINQAGLRMDREVPMARTGGIPRVLFLGDSFTFGHGVDAPHRFTDLIQESWPQAEILNFGVSGTGTDQELLHYREQGARYSADLVVLGFYVKCAKRNGELAIRTPRGWRPKPRFELQDGELILTHVPVSDSLVTDPTNLEPLAHHRSAIAPAKRYLQNHSRLYVFVRDSIHGGFHEGGSSAQYPEYDSARPEWQVTAAILKEMALEVRGNGSKFAVAFFPSLEEMQHGAPTHPRDQVRDLCADLDIPFLDLLPIFLDQEETAQKEGRPLYYPIDRHWTKEGHALAARSLLPWVKSLLGNPAPAAMTRKNHKKVVLHSEGNHATSAPLFAPLATSHFVRC